MGHWHRAICIFCAVILLAACAEVAKHNSKGNSSFRSGEYDAALLAYQQAQVSSPDESASYFNAAAAQISLGAYDSAIAALEQALRNADASITGASLYNLGNAYYSLGQYDRAVEAYRAALRHNPEDNDARYNLELAQLLVLPPSPTAQEQQTIPESGETDPTVTPTDQPGGFDGPTATPPPIELAPSATPASGEGLGGDADSSTPVPLEGGGMTVQQAEQFLDQVQIDQQALNTFLTIPASEGEFMEKDW